MSDLGSSPLDDTGLATEVVNLADPNEQPIFLRQGIVSSVASAEGAWGSKDAKISVRVGADPEPTPNLRFLGPAPMVDDSVWMLQFGEGDYLVLGALAASMPVGAILMGPSTPWPGWIPCDGRSTTGYPKLASLYGSTIPDLRGRSPLGAGSGTGLTPRTVGQTGGQETNNTVPQHVHPMPHTHTIAHTHTVAKGARSVDAHRHWNEGGRLSEGPEFPDGTSNFTSSGSSAADSGASSAANTSNNSGTASVTNMQPFAVVQFLIRYG